MGIYKRAISRYSVIKPTGRYVGLDIRQAEFGAAMWIDYEMIRSAICILQSGCQMRMLYRGRILLNSPRISDKCTLQYWDLPYSS